MKIIKLEKRSDEILSIVEGTMNLDVFYKETKESIMETLKNGNLNNLESLTEDIIADIDMYNNVDGYYDEIYAYVYSYLEGLKKSNEDNKFAENRPSWDEYFLRFAKLASIRSTCIRRKVGAVIVKDNRIVATGYNGVPAGIRHCSEVGCIREQLGVESGTKHELCRGLHAEQNAIVSSANFGVELKDSTIYVTDQPCIICAKMIINAGIKRIVYLRGYPDKLSLDMLKEAKIKVEKYEI